MIEWLLFDGVDAEARAATVRRQLHSAFEILAHKTEPSIPWLEPTVSGTKIAGDSAVVSEVPPFSGNLPTGISLTLWLCAVIAA